MSRYLSVNDARQTIRVLLDELSPESLRTVLAFVQSMREWEQREPGPLYPTVSVSLDGLDLWKDASD